MIVSITLTANPDDRAELQSLAEDIAEDLGAKIDINFLGEE
jgi:hypothetical protein